MSKVKRVISQKERELLNEVLPMRRLVPMGYDVILQRKNKEYFLKLRQAKLLNVASEDANYKEPSTTVDLNAQLWNLQKYRPNVEEIQEKSDKLLKCLAIDKD